MKKRCQSSTTTGKRCKLNCSKKFCKKHSGSTRTVLEILRQQGKEQKRGVYKCLTGVERVKIRKYLEKIVKVPTKRKTRFYDSGNNLVAVGHERVVYGDHGAYLEFSGKQVRNLKVKEGQQWRKNNIKFAKYEWLETPSGAKVYKQTRTVSYADYRVGYYYVDPKILKF